MRSITIQKRSEREQMKILHFCAGKNKEEESKNKISEIQEMKDRLKQENDNLKRIKHQLKENQEKQKVEKEVRRTIIILEAYSHFQSTLTESIF